MKLNPFKQISLRITPQSLPIPGSTQVANRAGGFIFVLDDFARLRRFLILGIDGGTYYTTEASITRENSDVLFRCIAADGKRTVDEIVAISVAGRNPKQAPVLFALAAAAGVGDDDTRAYALSHVANVCRTGTMLFQFVDYVQQFRGWGRGLRRAVASWYTDRDVDSLALQLVKYQAREGWSHRDVLRLAKPTPVRGSATDLALSWAVGKNPDPVHTDGMPGLIVAHQAAHASGSPTATASLVRAHHRLPWEALKSEDLSHPEVWNELIPTMGIGALVRNLGRLTANGTLAPMSEMTSVVLSRLQNEQDILRSRLHPINVLAALMTYRNGRGVRGSLTWTPIHTIVDALDAAFYLSFGSVVPAHKRTLLALDVSGSMAGGIIAGVPGLSPRVASAAMVAVTLATEPLTYTIGFTAAGGGKPFRTDGKGSLTGRDTSVTELALSSRQRLDDIVRTISNLTFGGTDCALPMLYAMDRKMEIDTFVVYTDSETWAGGIHPSQALRQYRETMSIDAKLIVVGMVSNGFSIADPNDAGMLDVVGFDTTAPQLMADFAAARL
jgi:60 kDa SS-A/Ro ribonucleoprotein